MTWIVALLLAAIVGAKPPKTTQPFDVNFAPRAVLIERKFLRFDAKLPGYQISSGIDSIQIRPRNSVKIPPNFVLELHTGGLEHFELKNEKIWIKKDGDGLLVARNLSFSPQNSAQIWENTQRVPITTYFSIREKKPGVFLVDFAPQALELLRRECTFSWINFYR